MSYYPAWMDFAKVAFCVGGAMLGFATRSEPTGAKRGRMKLGACLLLAAGLGLCGVTGLMFNLRAQHLQTQGTVVFVTRSHGKNSRTEFLLQKANGETDKFSISGTDNGIQDNETVAVEYQAGSGVVLETRVLDGANTGREAEDSDGTLGSVLACGAAIVILLYGVVNFLSDGLGAVADSEENLRPMPDGDVDSSSILKL